MVWPLVFGPGFPAYGHVPGVTGVATGPLKDRHVNNHGERKMALTEPEYQRVWQWFDIQMTGFSVGAAGAFLARALFFQKMRSMSNDGSPRSAEDSPNQSLPP